MNSFRMWSLGLLPLLAGAVLAQNSVDMTTSPIALLSQIPQCSVSCVTSTFLDSGCSLDAVAPCICTNVTLLQQMSQCIQSSCTFQDQLELSSSTGGFCRPYPHASRSWELKLVVAVLSVLAFPIVGLRLITRWKVAGQLELDDWITLLATICLSPTLACVVSAANLGFGLHFWNIDVANVQHLMQLSYATQMLYVIVLIMAKLSIVALFGRLFPDHRFQILNKSVMAFLICHGLVFFLVIMFQCTPISGVWNPTTDQKCVDIQNVALASAILGIIEDFFILGMPIQQLRNLQLGKKKKLAVCFMLSLGSFACITSIVRLQALVILAKSYDITWDNVDAVKWSITEISCALICGSLPALRPVFKKIPGLFSTLRGSRATVEMKGPAGRSSGHLSIRQRGLAAGLRSPVPEPSLSDWEDSYVITIHMAEPADVKMKPLPPSPSRHESANYQPPRRDSEKSPLSLWMPRTAMLHRTPITLTTPTNVMIPRRKANAESEVDLEGHFSTKIWM
ncbi:hypothetical protein LX32DRAFT_621229 [Colletotrichum zoysiae]|uniref:CFEM domain-containing protein n=1 Tax=Colletotrichum zoysiae TaxID=1216348 RepID=A0AAD9LZY7_9PEZI|nr:hypothetical protein LX32DRAFT_621229 [Colletotrichum zoysiae]